MREIKDKYFRLKAWVVIVVQMFLVAFPVISYYIYPWTNLTKMGTIIVLYVYYSSQYTIVIILTVAFLNLRNCNGENYSLSKKNIIV